MGLCGTIHLEQMDIKIHSLNTTRATGSHAEFDWGLNFGVFFQMREVSWI